MENENIIYKGWEILKFTENHYEVPIDDYYVGFGDLYSAMDYIDEKRRYNYEN